ncbi:hypothetical protein ASE48_23645 [Mycobacterium sp. Root265]|nr:hypothetical protein ASE48_23645 [Mycobacterium sp. Root265]
MAMPRRDDVYRTTAGEHQAHAGAEVPRISSGHGAAAWSVAVHLDGGDRVGGQSCRGQSLGLESTCGNTGLIFHEATAVGFTRMSAPQRHLGVSAFRCEQRVVLDSAGSAAEIGGDRDGDSRRAASVHSSRHGLEVDDLYTQDLQRHRAFVQLFYENSHVPSSHRSVEQPAACRLSRVGDTAGDDVKLISDGM